jgi:phosphoglycerol transferase MdoB-like AlkP superfamily enzyme
MQLPKRKWSEAKGEGSLSLRAAAMSAVFLTVLYAGICYLRFGTRGEFQLSRSEMLIVAGWSLFSYLLIFLTIFIALQLIGAVAARFSVPARARFFLRLSLGSVAAVLIIRGYILSAISFDGGMAYLYAASVSVTIAGLLGGIRLKLTGLTNEAPDIEATPVVSDEEQAVEQDAADSSCHVQAQPEKNQVKRLNALFSTMRRRPAAYLSFVWLTMITIAAYALSLSLARMDWDFLLQKLAVLAVWTVTFFALRSMARATKQRKQYSLRVLLLLAAVSLGLFRYAGTSAQAAIPRVLRNENLNVSATLETYAAHDISFRVSQDIFTAVSSFSVKKLWKQYMGGVVPTAVALTTGEVQAEPDEDNGFYGYLKRNTNLLPTVQVAPVEVKLVENLKPTNKAKPNIFVIVVDSLRQDYLSPYNPKVTFTPQVESFARESVVMQNSFTPYGGTVLSEPAIWSGTMQLHKQYIEPYYPMNALQKLLEAENYEMYLTVDPVLEIIVKPSPGIVKLDQNANTWQALDLNHSLKELQSKLDARTDRTRPVFAYTQPQNLHLRNLELKRAANAPADDVPGFENYYATRVHQLDQAFGEFVAYLKSTGEYDNSIIILTSDHGDALGELGRWGHGTWIYPEILRIPLIVHLPPKMRDGLYCDEQTAAFSSDITPTLYYLLGQRPVVRNEVFGKPLFTETANEQASYRQRSYLVASSYGPTYGILSNNGRFLFISDAANQKDYYFDLVKDSKGLRNLVTADVRARNEQLIRGHIEGINRFFNFREK